MSRHPHHHSESTTRPQFGAMLIRRRDAEAGAETQMNIDLEAGGSNTDACWKQLGGSWEEKTTQIGRI